MANVIELVRKDLANLDEVYRLASRTSVLDTTSSLITETETAGSFRIPKLSMDGLGDYNRETGYAAGSVSLSFETKEADYDRGRKFGVDNMDNEESLRLAFGQLASQFMRDKVVPEADAFRMAKYAGLAGTSKEGTIADGNAVLTELITGQSALDNSEVGEESRYLFITNDLFNAVDNVDTTKSRNVLASFGDRIVKMPTTRFYTAIDMLDGKTEGETAGGYKKATAGKDINFMIIDKMAVMQFAKSIVNKIITPELNQTSDQWLFFYRAYLMAATYDNKVKGIYRHNKAT